jgi:hypothetical protein
VGADHADVAPLRTVVGHEHRDRMSAVRDHDSFASPDTPEEL